MILGKVKGLRWRARAIESVLGSADAEEATTESTDDFSDPLEDGLAKQGFPAQGYRRPSMGITGPFIPQWSSLSNLEDKETAKRQTLSLS